MSLSVFRTANNLAPMDGSKVAPDTMSLTASVSRSVDLYHEMTGGDFEFVQAIYVDNRGAGDLTITVGGVNQVIVVKANTQGYIPVLASGTGSANFTYVSTATKTVNVIYINTPVAPIIWSTV